LAGESVCLPEYLLRFRRRLQQRERYYTSSEEGTKMEKMLMGWNNYALQASLRDFPRKQ
jgi:hypothetical protein